MPEAKHSQREAKLEEMEEAEREKAKYIESLKESRKVTTIEDKRDEEKKEWIKTSFWAPDNTPMVKEAEIKAPEKKLYCPAV